MQVNKPFPNNFISDSRVQIHPFWLFLLLFWRVSVFVSEFKAAGNRLKSGFITKTPLMSEL